MKISWHLKDFAFVAPYETVQTYFEGKLEKVRQLIGRLANDEVIEFKVDLYREDTKSKDDHYYVKVIIILPNQHTLVSEERGITPQECIDKLETSLATQVQKLKDKIKS